MKEILKVTNLRKSFGEKEILKGINLTLHEGENIGVIGKSGIGKSVLTKCIVRLIEPDDGEIVIFGKDILNLNSEELNQTRKKIGYLFQGGALYDSMSVRENMEFPVRRTKNMFEEKELTEMIESALVDVGLIDAIDKMPTELSGGMKKRIGLARALILKPEIILYDEPTTGLDSVTSNEISDLIISVQEKYKTSAIIITHDMKCAKKTTNLIKIMDDGIFTASGSYEELKNSENDKINVFFK